MYSEAVWQAAFKLCDLQGLLNAKQHCHSLAAKSGSAGLGR